MTLYVAIDGITKEKDSEAPPDEIHTTFQHRVVFIKHQLVLGPNGQAGKT
jgi:hypothetical protein